MEAVNLESAGNSQSMRAAEYLAQDWFHRRFILPATAEHDELQVSYADVGSAPKQGHDGSHFPTVLFIPGMFASRYLGVWMHAIAEKLGVRVLIIDRPGMGHSTDVPLRQRVDVWIELVPRLLAHLQIEHVTLAAHSAGTIFLLNTLARCRNILHPDRPLVALIAPWVDPAYSHVTTMQMAQTLPTSVFGIWHHLPKIVTAGGAAFNKIISLLPSSSGINAAETPYLQGNRQKMQNEYGMQIDLQKELQTLTQKSMFGESTVGADSEVLMCLRKGPAGLWGVCEDYAVFVEELAKLEKRRRVNDGGDHGGILKVSAYFAETDALVGKRGQSYMEGCWEYSGRDEYRDAFTFTTATIEGTDHDSVVQSTDVLKEIFLSAGGK